eukprot:238397-Alexandrium_andersonii.AAC.1
MDTWPHAQPEEAAVSGPKVGRRLCSEHWHNLRTQSAAPPPRTHARAQCSHHSERCVLGVAVSRMRANSEA